MLPLAGRLWPRGIYRRGDWRLLVPMVLFQPCFYFLLESYALTFTTSSQAGVIASSVPLWVAVGAGLFLAEAVSRRTLIGLVVSVAGVVGLTLLQAGDETAANPLFGNLLEVLAMASAAANMLMVKRLSARYNPWTLTAMQMAVGTVFFLPGLPLLIASGAAVWTPALVGAMVFSRRPGDPGRLRALQLGHEPHPGQPRRGVHQPGAGLCRDVRLVNSGRRLERPPARGRRRRAGRGLVQSDVGEKNEPHHPVDGGSLTRHPRATDHPFET